VTDRKRSEAWSQLMERAIAATSNGILITDATQRDNPAIYANPAATKLTGYSVSEILGHNSRFLQGSDVNQPDLKRLRTAIKTQQECKVVVRNYRKDGTLFWNELYISPVQNEQGQVTHFIGIQNDITEQKRAEAELRTNELNLRAIINTISDGIVIIDQTGKIVFVNPAGQSIFGQSSQALLGQEFGLPYLVNTRVEISILNTHKGLIPVELSVVETVWQESPAYLISLRDLTERRQAEEKIRYIALHDTLTNLPNRVLFLDRLCHVLYRCQRQNNWLFAVLFIDLDRFKVVNDSLGHEIGDQLLKAFARRIENCLRPCDTLARLGGDEFTILLEELHHLEDATKIAQQINTLLLKPFNLRGYKVFTNASIGITLGSLDHQNPEDLLREADTAMYHAKAQGKGCYAVFDEEMHRRALQQLQLEIDLRRAVEQGELAVYYQPIVCLTTGKLVGFEALLRWHHPHQGFISPDRFIPLAEETGLILEIGKFVLQQACTQLHQWHQQFVARLPLKISVNLSSRQLSDPRLVEQILEILATIGLQGYHLCLEITESLLMQNPDSVASMLQQLNAHQIQLAMDDFGTGYSSLSYLHRFPMQVLKIDRTFVQRLGTETEDLEIIRTIVTLAHNLGRTVVAEGIETEEQLKQLRTLGCELGQGYWFAKALSSEAASQLLTDSPQWSLT
jgi:diguanylate cyclase (GGDEF)-like protein/PAS domain S-box-containing protein